MTREEVQDAWEKIVDTGFSNYHMLTKDQKIWFNIEPLTTSGIIDHYINSGADHNMDTIDALEYLGFNDIAEMMRKVNSLFKDSYPPSNILERNEQWNKRSEGYWESILDEIDLKFWQRCEQLESKLLIHINKTNIGK
jgi:hypothetical protein